MNTKDVRNWLGIYLLVLTGSIGGYILFFGGPKEWLLPLENDQVTATFQIIVPVLIGQLAVIFRWFGESQGDEEETLAIPVWAVKGPLIMVTILLLLALIYLPVSNRYGMGFEGKQFMNVVTFSVTILNATTIFVIGRYFKKAPSESNEAKKSSPM